MRILTLLFGIASAVLPAPSLPPPSAPLNECFCFGCGSNTFPRGSGFFCAISTTTCNVDFGSQGDGCFNSYSSTAVESAGGCAFCECSRSAQGAFSGSCVDTPKPPPSPPSPPSPPPPRECECLSCNTTSPPLDQPGQTCSPPVEGKCDTTSSTGEQSCFANAYPNSSSLLPPPPSSPPANIDLSLYNGTWTGSDFAMSASSGGLVRSFKTVNLVATSDGALRGTVNYTVVDGDAYHDGTPVKTGQESVFGMVDLVTGEIGLVEAAEQGMFTGSLYENGEILYLLQLQSAIVANPSNNQSASNALVASMNLTRTTDDTLQMRPMSLKTVLNTTSCTGEWRGTDHAYSLSKGLAVATIKTVRLVCDSDGGVTGNMSYFIVSNETGTNTDDNPVANDTEAVIGLFDESDSSIVLVEDKETGHYVGKIDANGDLVLTQTQTKVSLNAEISQPASNALVAQIKLTKVVPGIDVAASPRNAIIIDPTWCSGTWTGTDDAFSVSLDRVLVADKKLVLSCNVYGDLYGYIQYTVYDGSGFDHHGNAVKGDVEYVGGQIMLSSEGEYSFALVKAQKQGRFQGKFVGADISLLQLQNAMLLYEPSGQTASNGIVAFMHLTKEDIVTSCNCDCETGMCLSLPPSPPLPPVNPSPLSPPPPSPAPSPPPPPSTPPKSSSSNGSIIAVAVAVPVGILLVGVIILIVAL